MTPPLARRTETTLTPTACSAWFSSIWPRQREASGSVTLCNRGGLGELDLPVLADGEHPVDHAAVDVDSEQLSI
jgi:hypothetical protein